MKASELIRAKKEGVSFDRLLHAIESDRAVVSELPADKLDFLESMVSSIKEAGCEFEEALRRDDLVSIKRTASSIRDILDMVEDSCE